MGIGLDVLLFANQAANPSPDPPFAPRLAPRGYIAMGSRRRTIAVTSDRRGVIAEISLEDVNRPVSLSKCLSQRMGTPARRL
jgi:hypothetical protein